MILQGLITGFITLILILIYQRLMLWYKMYKTVKEFENFDIAMSFELERDCLTDKKDGKLH